MRYPIDTNVFLRLYALVAGETDLDGNPRIYGDRVDMGAYEWFPGTMNYETWLSYYNQSPSSDSETKWVAGLNPTDPDAKFLTHIAMRDGKPALNWTPNLNRLRTYTIEGRTELTSPWFTIPPDQMPTTSARFFRVKVEYDTLNGNFP